jgi:hypothetical protein
MTAPFKIAMATALALGTAAPAAAQYYRPTQQYQQDSARYEVDRASYERQREMYERQRADWERARADYDARYGYGAYARRYGAAPVWDTSRWGPYDSYASNRAYDNRAYDAGRYGRDTAYSAPTGIRCNNNSSVTAGIIGALAGAALGSNVAARNARTEGAVLGAVVGGGIGAAVGNANDRYKCDARGPYFSYNDTVPYREATRYRSDRYSYYQRQRCRLAPAPADSSGQDYRYVRVCPDAEGRYRITG